MNSIISLISKGGPINGVLVGAYFLVLIVVLERLFFFLAIRGSDTQAQDLVESVLTEDSHQNPSRHPQLRQVAKTPFFDLLNQWWVNPSKPLLERVASQRLSKMDASLWILQLVGHLAPMLGLLGTMTGLVKAFQGIENSDGLINFHSLSGGIWEAMMTTVVGLVVGIIALLFHRIFDQHVQKKVTQMNHFLAWLTDQKRPEPS